MNPKISGKLKKRSIINSVVIGLLCFTSLVWCNIRIRNVRTKVLLNVIDSKNQSTLKKHTAVRFQKHSGVYCSLLVR